MFYHVDTDGLVLFIRLIPKASADSIVGVERKGDGKKYLVVRLRALPEDGKANKALIKFLARQWGIPPSRISFRNGTTSRYKKLHFLECSGKLEQILQSLNDDTLTRK
ncbi:hypothetical protein BAnh1_02950 [Bartonella australis AUST/NH1]|uniref:UPF0235 protein BAnh1_02950 n=1 Tax=Bartonella australis (strain Aust/NH1) TaxID=1094489 RepID=M1NS57_BARAA|nr:DUF167 domain-containing protein [Bartonella australis]AGF74178.1 hypothetical protein BAnh1_02950 [Bartonella australis AUST/NH1]